MSTEPLAIPDRLDLTVEPTPSRAGWAAVTLANDFKMRVHATRYVQPAAAVPGAMRVQDVSALEDPVLRETAKEVVLLWNSVDGTDHESYDLWSRRMLDLNLASLEDFAGPLDRSWAALRHLGADAVEWEDRGSHHVALRMAGPVRLLAQLDAWLDGRPTPRAVLLDLEPEARHVTARVFGAQVGDLLRWATQQCARGLNTKP